MIGLLRISDRLKQISTVGDDLLSVDALTFLASCFLAYIALRTRRQQRKYRVEQVADWLFLAGLCLMAVICALITYEFV